MRIYSLRNWQTYQNVIKQSLLLPFLPSSLNSKTVFENVLNPESITSNAIYKLQHQYFDSSSLPSSFWLTINSSSRAIYQHFTSCLSMSNCLQISNKVHACSITPPPTQSNFELLRGNHKWTFLVPHGKSPYYDSVYINTFCIKSDSVAYVQHVRRLDGKTGVRFLKMKKKSKLKK